MADGVKSHGGKEARRKEEGCSPLGGVGLLSSRSGWETTLVRGQLSSVPGGRAVGGTVRRPVGLEQSEARGLAGLLRTGSGLGSSL